MPKFRDNIVLLSQSLEELDGKAIKSNERQYLQNLVAKRRMKQPVIHKKTTKKEGFEV